MNLTIKQIAENKTLETPQQNRRTPSAIKMLENYFDSNYLH